MSKSRRYGIASRGVHQGEYTLCTAKNMETCPNHVHGSHKTMTDEEYESSNESLIARRSTSNRKGFLSKARVRLSHRRANRDRADNTYRNKIRRTVASIAIAACLVPALAACGNNTDYIPSTNANDAYSQSQQSNQDSSSNNTSDESNSDYDYSEDISKAKNKAKDLYNKAKTKAYEYSQTEDWANKKESLKKGGQYLKDQLESYLNSSYSSTGSANDGSANVNGFPHQGTNQDALNEMSTVNVAEADGSSYNRSSYKHWVSAGEAPNWDAAISCMDVRDAVIATQADNVQLSSDGCSVESATTNDAYGAINRKTGTTTFDVKNADVDHIVPLEYVNSHGGASWSSQQKQNYANDKNNLILASSTANRQKGSKGPSEWMPNGTVAQCSYARSWAGVLSSYGISASRADYDTIVSTLQSCQANGQ